MLKNRGSDVDVAFSPCEYAKPPEENINIKNMATNKTKFHRAEYCTEILLSISIIILASELINEGARGKCKDLSV